MKVHRDRKRLGLRIFTCQSADDDGVETNLSDEARRDTNSVRVVAGDRNRDECPKRPSCHERREAVSMRYFVWCTCTAYHATRPRK